MVNRAEVHSYEFTEKLRLLDLVEKTTATQVAQ
jgi:hypothetical protein